MNGIQSVYRTQDSLIADMVANELSTSGVPTTLEAAEELATRLYPAILERRQYVGQVQRELVAATYPGLDVVNVPHYPLTALFRLVLKSAGLTPSPRLARVEVYDEETQRLQTASVAPWVMPDNDDARREFSRRLTAGSGRHVRGASRDIVTETARANGVGWARQLTGSENCGFCAMLASRGAVYSRKTVRFEAHDNCDCTATIVYDNGEYDGKDTADELQALWRKSGGLSDFTKKYREMRKNEPVAA